MKFGTENIARSFSDARQQNRAALMPYYPVGYPDLPTSLEVLATLAEAGADLIELGVPFSDPLADGPTIQKATQVALERGASLAASLEQAAALRQRGFELPILLMSYFNPLLAYGLSRLVAEVTAIGIDGLIVPDLPPEEAGDLAQLCHEQERALIFFLAPTSTPERLVAIPALASGFLYLVSLTGVTGARQALPSDLTAFIARVRAQTGLPLAVGFGISTPAQAVAVGKLADGVIVGSALIEAVELAGDPCQAARLYLQSLSQALET